VTLAGSGSDPDGQPVSFLWVQTGGPAVVLSSPTIAAPTFTAPEVGPVGATVTLLLTVSAGGASATGTTTVAVQDVNRLPTAIIVAPTLALEGTTIALQGSASFDPDGTLASYRWTVDAPLPTGAALRDADQAVASFDTGTVGADTTVTFHLVVGDGLTVSAVSSFTVTVLDLNHAPVAVVGDDLTVSPGVTVTLSAAASSDADGQALAYAWRQVSGPSVALTGGTTAAPTFTAPQVSSTTMLGFEVTVTDGHGGSATTRQSVLVVAPPRASSGGCSSGDVGSLSLLALLGLARWRRRGTERVHPTA
jgi:MYXO-CTERM domain-containing protein